MEELKKYQIERDNNTKIFLNFEQYIDNEVKKASDNLTQLEKIEKTRNLQDDELKYKHQLQGAYFTLCEIRNNFIKEM